MGRQGPKKRWYVLLSFVFGEMNKTLLCYIFIKNGEEVWVRQNSSVTCRPWHLHFFHCPFNSPSGGRASRVHGSTTRQASVSSQLRRQSQRYLFYFLPKWGYSIVMTDQYCKIHPPSGGGAFRVHGLKTRQAYVYVSKFCCSFILYLIYFIMIFADIFVLMVLVYIFIDIIFLFVRLTLFLICVYCYSTYSRIYCSYRILFWSSDHFFPKRVWLYKMSLFFVWVWSVCWGTNIYEKYHYSFTINCTYILIY